MYNYDKSYISKRASEYGFIRDTLEKVYRLADILEYLNKEPRLKEKLAFKGGTAINLTVFNLPRLSVDIDLDYFVNDSREEMLQNRDIINVTIASYMELSRYRLSPKTKKPHSLDSWVYEYVNLGGNKDTIKIEINYSLRAHVFPAQEMRIITEHFESEYKLNCLNVIEIAENYAEDQITKMRDEVRIAWEYNKKGLAFFGSVIVDGEGVIGNSYIRNNIFYNEMPTALQALRQADRFLFDKEPKLDNTPVFIHFISSNPVYDKIYDFGVIGIYK